jgi:SAM-dependent methyltransferase
MHEPRERIRRHYEHRAAPGRAGFEVADWASAEAQAARFGVLIDLLRHPPLATVPPQPPLRLLDAGCGVADLADALAAAHVPVRYVGLDLPAGVLSEARRRHPGLALVQADLFTALPFAPGSFDVVFASGVFNLDLTHNDAILERAVPALMALARKAFVVNFLHLRAARQYPHCRYFDPAQLLRRFAGLAPRIALRDDYLENDFTLVFQAG